MSRLLVALVALSLATPALSQEHASLVLRNAVVHTVDPGRPRAEAVAVGGGRILAVGDDRHVRAHIGPDTRVLDLDRLTVVPGFDDSHAHLLGIGFARLDVDLVGTTGYGDVVDRVAAEVRTRPAGEWIRGRGWHEEKWRDPPEPAVRGFPTHDALSAVSPESPVLLKRADGHATLANARAMSLLGITSDTAAPDGGEIVRDESGRPTGIFVDNAQDLLPAPERSPRERERALELAMAECVQRGVTSLTDAGATVEELDLYRRFARAGRLSARVYAMVSGPETMRAVGRPEVGLGGGFLTIRSMKLYADGALGSRGAALLEPYSDDPGNRGLVVTPPADLLAAVRDALVRGFQVGIHAIGDRGNRIVLDVYEEALAEAAPEESPRLRIEHAQILDGADIGRFAELGVLAVMQGIHCTSDRPWAPSRLGEDRVKEGGYVWRTLLRSGARVVNGTDAPVEDLSPIQNFHATVTRQDAHGHPPGGFDPDQRMTREEALRSMTLDGAYASFQEDEKGSIVRGKRADLVILSRDILTVPDDQILGTEVLATILDGRMLYESLELTRTRPAP